MGLGNPCSKCRSAVPESAEFCPKCGTPTQAAASPSEGVCRSCRKPLEPGDAFCPHCGGATGPLARTRRPGLGRGWRSSYASSQGVGMTLGMVGIALMVFLFLGPLMVIPALLILGLVWIVRKFAGKAKAPSAERRDSAKARQKRGSDRRREVHAADPASPSGAVEHADE